MSAKRKHEYAIQGPSGEVVGTMINEDVRVVQGWLETLDVEYPDHRFNVVARTVIVSEWVVMPRIPRANDV